MGKNKTVALCILSGGLDSTCVLAKAVHKGMKGEFQEVEAITFRYGQRHDKEIECAERIAELYKVRHNTVKLQLPDSVISGNFTGDVPNTSYDKIEGVSPTYVPFRNGNFISQAAAIAAARAKEVSDRENTNCKYVLMLGTHAEDAQNDAYPDCRLDFIGAMGAAIHIGTYGQVRLSSPFIESQKSEIVRAGANLGAPLNMTWSCYKGGQNHCGQCPTCISRQQAFEDARVNDPTVYDEPWDDIPF